MANSFPNDPLKGVAIARLQRTEKRCGDMHPGVPVAVDESDGS
jgi:hypothetical protein